MASRPSQSTLCRLGGEGGYEKPSKLLFVVYLTAKKHIYFLFMDLKKLLPRFKQNFSAKCSVFWLLFSDKCYQSPEIAGINII
jgi:hypothetical protein